MKSRLGDAGDDLGQRGLAHARRAPEDDRAGIVALDLQPQRLAGPEHVLLADELVERARAHAVGQRRGPVRRLIRATNWIEQAHVPYL